LAVWWSGSITRIGDIPPKKEAYFNSGECTVQLEDNCNEVNVISFGPHAHFLGKAIWTEHYRPDQYGQLTYVRSTSPTLLVVYSLCPHVHADCSFRALITVATFCK
jgi:hypothetical protein